MENPQEHKPETTSVVIVARWLQVSHTAFSYSTYVRWHVIGCRQWSALLWLVRQVRLIITWAVRHLAIVTLGVIGGDSFWAVWLTSKVCRYLSVLCLVNHSDYNEARDDGVAHNFINLFVTLYHQIIFVWCVLLLMCSRMCKLSLRIVNMEVWSLHYYCAGSVGVSRRRGMECRDRLPDCLRSACRRQLEICLNKLQTCCISWRPLSTQTSSWPMECR